MQMPRLCLFRHAKSDWFAGATNDFDRPISSRGERDAPLVIAYLIAKGWKPDRILCSPAKRARQTLEILAGVLECEPEIMFPAGLYDASVADYAGLIRTHGGDAELLMVIGHNPMMHDTALSLAAPGNSPKAAGPAKKFPTSAIAVLDFTTKWADIAGRSGKLVAFVKPTDLRK